MSGLATRRFCFEAFLPREKKERAEIVKELEKETRTIIVYEAPHHLIRTLEELYAVLGDRRIRLCRELTKKHEEVFPTTFAEALSFYQENDPRGEYVIVIEGKSRSELKIEQQKEWEAMTLQEHMAYYEDQGTDRKEAMKLVAKDRGISKRDVYQALLER